MVQSVIGKELRLSNCGFNHNHVDSFVRSQWQSKATNTFYLIYRWIFAVFVVATVIISLYTHITHNYPIGIFFIYLTHWGIIMNMIVGIYGAVLVTIWQFNKHFRESFEKTEEIPISLKIFWALYNIAVIVAFVITIVYWSILYDAAKGVTLVDVLSHGMNSVIMFIDILIVAYPMRLYHIIQPICFGAGFGLFSYIYHLCGGLNEHGESFIYPVLNWEKTEKALTTTAGVHILLIVIYIIFFCIYKVRVFTQRRLFATKFVLPTTTKQTTSSK